ncbi:MAG: hypothetical protein FJ125_11990, partial [Deltaproteobacteria bacterium]|nr:hypothetical protein [Deltaproteobacteria bacterium]
MRRPGGPARVGNAVLLKLIVLLAVLHSLVVAVVIVMEKRNPTSALAWLLGITFFPFVGVWAYLLLGRRRFLQRATSMDLASQQMQAVLPSPSPASLGDTTWDLQRVRIHPAQRALMALARNIGELP